MVLTDLTGARQGMPINVFVSLNLDPIENQIIITTFGRGQGNRIAVHRPGDKSIIGFYEKGKTHIY